MDAAPIPTEQHTYPGLPALPIEVLHRRREGVFLVLSGLFLGTLAILNILGISRFIDLGFEVFGQPVMIAVGVLPYPITFLCTDFISELYGRERASAVVWMGLALNLWLVLVLWLGGILPAAGPAPEDDVFMQVRALTFAAVTASMLAYLAAQFVDVHLFHFWKRLTRGRHLWLRNNASTVVSQLVDTTAVILVTHFIAAGLPVDPARSLWPQLFAFVFAGYVFKLVAALADTLPFYLGASVLSRYLRLRPAVAARTAPEASPVAGS
ncbi:MAG: queuosine precursor transporter [Myxococcales bacterium]|nr:queuosine precursor transporter [Myxococcales bacterium]